MTPEEYEHHVAAVLRAEGWDAQVTPVGRDLGLDVIAKFGDRRLGVQVKMYGGSTRRVNSEVALHLYGAAAYADCSECMIATNGDVQPDAVQIANKLGIEIRHIPANHGDPHTGRSAGSSELNFGAIWSRDVKQLEGLILRRADGKTNLIERVDGAGITRRTSSGASQRIRIETIRWAIERLLAGETVTRDEINQRDPKRVSSGVMLVLVSLPMFEAATIGRALVVRLRSECAAESRGAPVRD
jgi:hypothetical protein